MIPDKIKAIFNFIDFLDKNKKKYIKDIIPLVNELKMLHKQRCELNPDSNYKDKQKYDEIQRSLLEKFASIKNDVATPILSNLTKLKIWNGDDLFTSIYNSNIVSVRELITNFTSLDIKEIKKYEHKYLSFRKETNTDFLSLSELFHNLDEVLNRLFDFFKDEEILEMENGYKNFNELFDDAARNGGVSKSSNTMIYNNDRTRYGFEYGEWLHEMKGCVDLNGQHKREFLNKETFLEFLVSKRQKDKGELKLRGNEKSTWAVTPHQQTKTKAEQEWPTFINNFDNISPGEIYGHFKAGLVDKGYLTEQELNDYLKAAFEFKVPPETLFRLKHIPKKQKIYTVFYCYYKDISQKKHERQKEYAALLGDYFEGYKTQIIQTNWAREYLAKR